MSARHPLEAYAESYEQMERRGERPAARSVAADIRYNMMPATLSVDTIATLRSDNERLGRERDSEHQLRIRLEIQRDEANAYGDEEAKRAQSAEAERDTLLAQVEKMRSALEPFAWVGQWLFARDLPDDTPIVTIQGLGKDVHLTRGMFKAAHTAALTKEPS